MKWATSLKPGDLINQCFSYPFNDRVAKIISIDRMPFGRRGWIIESVTIEGTDGRWHYCPGGGCVSPPLSVLEIKRIILSSAKNEGELRVNLENYRKNWEARDYLTDEEALHIENRVNEYRKVKDGHEVTDAFGIKL